MYVYYGIVFQFEKRNFYENFFPAYDDCPFTRKTPRKPYETSSVRISSEIFLGSYGILAVMHQRDTHPLLPDGRFAEAAHPLNHETANGATATRPFRTSRGRSSPLGAIPLADGVNFVMMCRHGTSVHLVLQHADHDDLLAEIPLDPHRS